MGEKIIVKLEGNVPNGWDKKFVKERVSERIWGLANFEVVSIRKKRIPKIEEAEK